MADVLTPPRRAKVRLTAVDLHRFLDLPDGLRVVAVQASNDPVSFSLIVEGDALDPTPWDCEAPYLPGAFAREVAVHDENGRPYMRFSWTPEVVSA